MRLFSLKNVVLSSAVALVTLAGAISADAQNRGEYRDYIRAQREAQREYREYLRTRSRSDYRDWQRAQREAQRELREYQQSSRYNNRSTRRVYNTYNTGITGQQRYYRVYRDGNYYQTDYRGAELLRQAVNSGYQQGYRQAQNDRRYGRGNDYYGSNVYRMGTYGYQTYVARDQYQYYFQQGFQRGYEDGYNNQLRYGYRSGNNYNILGTILSTILNFAN